MTREKVRGADFARWCFYLGLWIEKRGNTWRTYEL